MNEAINPENSLEQLQMQPDQLAAYHQAQEIIGSLSSKEHYIKVYSCSHDCPTKHLKAPIIVVYKEKEDVTIKQLVQKYALITDQEEDEKDIQFILEGGYQLEKQKTTKQIKKQLRLDTLDGLNVYFKTNADYLFINQCAAQSIIESALAFNKSAIQVAFALPGMNYCIYVPIQPKAKSKNKQLYEWVLGFLQTEIQRIFAKKVQKSTMTLVLKLNDKQLVNQSINYSSLTKQDRIQVKFKEAVKLSPAQQNNTYLVITGQGVTSQRLHYDYIKDRKLKDVLNQIQPRPKWQEFGLIINQFVIKPEEKFSKADSFMKNSNAVTKNFAGKIIPETLVFLAEQKRVRKLSNFDIEKIIDRKQSNLAYRTTCQSMLKDRADKTSHISFKGDLKSLEPILLYTSQLNVKPSDEKEMTSPLYKTLNLFLRKQQFRLTTEEDYKSKWEYTFTSELHEQLKKIDPLINQVLWRGVSYQPQHKVGDRVLYKQFNSTSSSQQQAKQLFAKKALFKITKSYSGKPIKDFSYYNQIQSEVLFQPYIEFEVKKISQIKNQYKGNELNQYKGNELITLIEMEEIRRPEMPDSKALYLLWVDDKTKEGLMMWNSLRDIKDTSVMIPFLTTEQLKVWLDKNRTLLNDKTVQFVLVTNMTRVQKGVKKDEAGVEAIKLYRQFKPEGHVFVYIGWVEGTLNKLKKYNLNPNEKLRVSNVQQTLRTFLNEVGGLK